MSISGPTPPPPAHGLGSAEVANLGFELDRVRAEATERGPGAFLLTVTDDGRPHVVAVGVGWDDEGGLAMSAGRTSVRNARGRPGVTVLWPPSEPGGYSLIVDGTATAEPDDAGDGGRVSVAVTRAVLHRPAVAPAAANGDGAAVSGEACGSDCVPLLRRR